MQRISYHALGVLGLQTQTLKFLNYSHLSEGGNIKSVNVYYRLSWHV